MCIDMHNATQLHMHDDEWMCPSSMYNVKVAGSVSLSLVVECGVFPVHGLDCWLGWDWVGTW